MAKYFIILTTLLISSCSLGTENNTYAIVWSEEFNYSGQPDTTKWSYDTGDGCPDLCGWGNNELQYYTDRIKNVRVQDGHMLLEAHRENYKNREYTSARILTRNKISWKYGRFEIRARLPSGKGTWPAIWMLPEEWVYGGWPESGEIDIMEHVGYEAEFIYGSIHTEAYNHVKGTQKTYTLKVPDAESTFHTYRIDWTPDKIDWYVDDRQYGSFENKCKSYEEWPFDHEFHLILNIAVGGNWGGARGVEEDIWPQKMEIDYIRVHRKSDYEE